MPDLVTSSGNQTLAIGDISGLVFGRAPHPVKCGFGWEIGAGIAVPEVNFRRDVAARPGSLR
jgi:hypothetical protein